MKSVISNVIVVIVVVDCGWWIMDYIAGTLRLRLLEIWGLFLEVCSVSVGVAIRQTH